MTPTRHKAVHLLFMALALGLIAMVILASACGPSAPAGQSDATPETEATPTLPWLGLGTPPTEEQLATLRAQTQTHSLPTRLRQAH